MFRVIEKLDGSIFDWKKSGRFKGILAYNNWNNKNQFFQISIIPFVN